jgi:hypothetical protein
MEGDVDGAWRHSEEAEELGRRAGSANADAMVLTLRAAIAQARGTTHEIIGELERVTELSPGYPVAEIASAVYFTRAGQPERGRRMLHRRLAAGVDSIPRDAEWLEALWYLGEAGLILDEPEAVRLAHEALTPYAELWAIDGIGGACFGVVSHQLGRLATRLGHFEEAQRWLTVALERHRSVGAGLLACQTGQALAELAEAQGGPPPPASGPAPVAGEGDFLREGVVWRLRFRGRSVIVPDSKGMRDLAALLAHPGRELHVLDLVEAAGGPPTRGVAADAGPLLDARARTAYRQRLAELEEEIAEAEARADVGRLAASRQERDFVAAELGRALGLGGRVRVAGDRVERARKAVTMRIATALRAIEAVDPALARHLRLAVSTGRFCVYRSEDPVAWRT